MRSSSLAQAAFVATSHFIAVQAQSGATGVELPSAAPTLNSQVVQGCFSSAGSLVLNSSQTFNSVGSCALDICLKGMGKAVAATTQGNQCFCGDTYPPVSDVVDDSNCNVGCTGWPANACGGIGFWTVYNTGLQLAVKNDGAAPSSASTSAATVTVSGTVVVVTQTSAPTNTPNTSSGSHNTAGIAAGVVVGVVVVAGLMGGFFVWLRRRRNQEIEEEHRRNAAVSAFIGGQKPPSSSGGFSVSDSRLDPVMTQRRMSDGSIADNEDYSRRILRVTNA